MDPIYTFIAKLPLNSVADKLQLNAVIFPTDYSVMAIR